MTEKIKPLQIIHLGICMGTILIYGIIGYLFVGTIHVTDIPVESLFYILIPLAAVLLSNFMYKTLVKKIGNQTDSDAQYSSYQSASILRWAILEGGALVILFLTPQILVFGFLLIAYMIFLRPTSERMNVDMQKYSF